MNFSNLLLSVQVFYLMASWRESWLSAEITSLLGLTWTGINYLLWVSIITKTGCSRPRPRPRSDVRDQDQDQDRMIQDQDRDRRVRDQGQDRLKLVSRRSRDQDRGLEDTTLHFSLSPCLVMKSKKMIVYFGGFVIFFPVSFLVIYFIRKMMRKIMEKLIMYFRHYISLTVGYSDWC